MTSSLALGSAALIASAPAAFAQSASPAAHPSVLFKTSEGDIRVELYPEKAPKTVANFLDYVKAGQYNGTIFHRVIKGFMIQGGGYKPNFDEKPTRAPIPLESKNGLKNLEFSQGDLQNPPIDPNSVDLVVLSQALHHAENPAATLRSAHKILKPGGQIMVLDLLKHNFEKAHELYGDRWPGFVESDLHRWLEEAGFKKVEISIVAAEEQPPHFQTILAGGEK